jgi:hypothetical protein
MRPFSSSWIVRSTSSNGISPTSSWSCASSRMYDAGRRSGRVESTCPSLMYAGPSSTRRFRNATARFPELPSSAATLSSSEREWRP